VSLSERDRMTCAGTWEVSTTCFPPRSSTIQLGCRPATTRTKKPTIFIFALRPVRRTIIPIALRAVQTTIIALLRAADTTLIALLQAADTTIAALFRAADMTIIALLQAADTTIIALLRAAATTIAALLQAADTTILITALRTGAMSATASSITDRPPTGQGGRARMSGTA
jgi:hypothetical protein